MERASVDSGPDGRDEASGAGDEALRAQLHGMWSSVAPAWAEHAAYLDAREAQQTQRLLELTAPAPGERVLELACGPGAAGLAAAPHVAPDGQVLMSDVAPEMTAIAAARARELGLENTATRELDIERIDLPADSYDVVLCRMGLMFATDPQRGAREIVRVLAPGGRVGIAVWAQRERNPWLGLVLDAVGAQIGRPVPPPGLPGPFALSDADRLGAILREAGLAAVEVQEFPVPLRVASFEDWWNRTSALAGPLAAILAAMPDEATESLRDRLREACAPYQGSEGIEFPGVSLLASGRSPE